MKKRSEQALLPYGLNSNVPKITLPDTELFKSERGSMARNYFENRVKQLNEEYEKLMTLAQENDLVYKAQYRFEPRVGIVYHLYQNKDNYILSIIEPHQWDMEHVGSYEFTADSIWKRVEQS